MNITCYRTQTAGLVFPSPLRRQEAWAPCGALCDHLPPHTQAMEDYKGPAHTCPLEPDVNFTRQKRVQAVCWILSTSRIQKSSELLL